MNNKQNTEKEWKLHHRGFVCRYTYRVVRLLHLRYACNHHLKTIFPGRFRNISLAQYAGHFAAGFIVRPFGALVFGRLGDLIGRKYTFLLTLVLMGAPLFESGLCPVTRVLAGLPRSLFLPLRLVQGLALGGEYGGAATYVAEHAPANRRGFWTSWIQTTATLVVPCPRYYHPGKGNQGVKISLLSGADGVILSGYHPAGDRFYFHPHACMSESPMFAKVKAEDVQTH